MKRTVLALALSLVLLPISAQCQSLVPMPSEGKLLGGVKSDTAGKWIVIAEGMTFIQPTIIDGGKSILFEGDAGKYGIVFFPPGDAQPLTTTIILKGDGSDPPPPPDPGGKKQMVMFYDAQTRDNLPNDQRQLMFSLKTIRDLEKSGHHVLEIVERSALGRSDLPARIASFAEAAKQFNKFPSVVMAPIDGGQVKVYSLPADYDGLVKILGEK